MKKIDLVHIAILVVALMAGYSAIETFVSFLAMVGYYSDILYTRSGMHSPVLSTLLIMLLLAGTCVLLITNGKRLATAILKNQHETAFEDMATVQLDRRSLIYVLLIGMGLYTLIQSIPHFLLDIFGLFQSKVAVNEFKTETADGKTIALELLRVTLGTFLIYAAPAISGFIDKKAGVKTEDGS